MTPNVQSPSSNPFMTFGPAEAHRRAMSADPSVLMSFGAVAASNRPGRRITTGIANMANAADPSNVEVRRITAGGNSVVIPYAGSQPLAAVSLNAATLKPAGIEPVAFRH